MSQSVNRVYSAGDILYYGKEGKQAYIWYISTPCGVGDRSIIPIWYGTAARNTANMLSLRTPLKNLHFQPNFM